MYFTDRGAASHAALNLGRILFPLFALALDMPEDWFDDKVGRILGLSRHYVSDTLRRRRAVLR